MAGITVTFPDCASVDSKDEGANVTVVTKDCQTGPPGPPPIFGAWEIAAFIVVGLAMVLAVAMVRYRAHEEKPRILRERAAARQLEIDGQVKLAQAQKRCGTCGDVYDPVLR